MYIKNFKNKIFVIACIFIQHLNTIDCYAQGSLDSISQKCINIALGKTDAVLQMGDTLPNIFTNMVGFNNDKSFIRTLSKGKILILDFWSQWCGSCIASFPHLEKLQEKYGGKILILPVTFQSRTSVDNFRKIRSGLNRPMILPTIVEDTLLRAFFPHNGDPFEVWIDSSGKVRGTTSQLEMNESVIDKVLIGDWHSVEPPKSKLDNNVSEANNFAELLFATSLKRYDPHFPDGRNIPITESGQKILRCKNAPVSWLFQWSLRNKYPALYFNKKRCLYLFKNSSTFKRLIINQDSIGNYGYVINNYYCYELKAPIALSDEQIFNIAYTDLKHYFKVSVRKEKRLMKCLKLVRTSSRDKISSDNTLSNEFTHEPDEDLFDYVKCLGTSITDLVSSLNNIKGIPYIVDSTNYYKKINLNFKIEKNAGLEALQLKLKVYDLKLIQSSQNMEMLIFEDFP